MENKSLTVKEALEQGYTHWGRDTGDFQHLSPLSEITDEDFNSGFERSQIIIAQKEPYYLSVTPECIRDVITDDICSQDNYKDDGGTIEDALKEMIGWKEFAGRINAVLRNHPYWYLTEIKLIP